MRRAIVPCECVQYGMYVQPEKRPRFLDIQGFSCDAGHGMYLLSGIQDSQGYLQGHQPSFAADCSNGFSIVFLVLTLFLKFISLVALETIMLGMLTYLLQKRRMPDIFQKNQLNAIENMLRRRFWNLTVPSAFPNQKCSTDYLCCAFLSVKQTQSWRVVRIFYVENGRKDNPPVIVRISSHSLLRSLATASQVCLPMTPSGCLSYKYWKAHVYEGALL